jgi:hypothetical protein
MFGEFGTQRLYAPRVHTKRLEIEPEVTMVTRFQKKMAFPSC